MQEDNFSDVVEEDGSDDSWYLHAVMVMMEM